MIETTFADHGIDIPYGSSGEVRVQCPQCTPMRKPQNQRKRELAVNVSEGGMEYNWGNEIQNAPGEIGVSRGLTQEVSAPMCSQSTPTPSPETIESLPRTRAEAIACGSKHYFTGKPCPNGHVAPRFVSNFGCDECLKAGYRERFRRDPERFREANRLHVANNPEANARRSAEWLTANPLMAVVIRTNTTAKRRGAVGTITLDEWQSLLERYGHRCIVCGAEDVGIGADHIVPIADGGPNTIDNIQPMCWDCNRKKCRRTIDYREVQS